MRGARSTSKPSIPGSRNEDQQVGRLVGGNVQPFLTRSGDGNLVALLLQGVLDPARDGMLVLDDQDGG